MNPKSKILFTLSFVSAVGSVAMAEDDIPIRYTRPMRNTVSVGMRIITSGAKVKFSNLGGIASGYRDYGMIGSIETNKTNLSYYPGEYTAEKDANGVATGKYKVAVNYYDNGAVYLDGRRTTQGISEYTYNAASITPGNTSELRPVVNGYYRALSHVWVTNGNAGTDAAGNPIYVYDVGGYKVTDVTSGQFLAFNESNTRSWTIASTDTQYVDSNGATTISGSNVAGVRMDRLYTATLGDAGGSFEGNSGAGPGFEIELDHIIRKESLRFEWGYRFGLGLSSINAKDSGTVKATLKDNYTIYKLASGFSIDPNTYAGSTNGFVSDADGNEITAPLSLVKTSGNVTTDQAVNGTENLTVDGSSTVNVTGRWQVKGAYYMIHFGPSARYYFSPRISVSGSAGIAGAYFGTSYVIDESYSVTAIRGITKTLTYASSNDQVKQRRNGMSMGYYGNVNAEFWLTPSTGVYAGVAYEKFGTYTQSVEGHKAAIDLGKGMVFKLGISTRF